MYDENNIPAPTQFSYYLRTGRLLPTECFGRHKAKKSADDDLLSYKSWTTFDFLDHYATGNGRSVNLDNIGLLDRFRNSGSVRRAVEDFKAKQVQLAKRKAKEICRKLERTQATGTHIVFSDQDKTTTNVTNDGPLFSIGRSVFFRSARSAIDVNCINETLRLEGILKFSIDDAFIDAIDISNMMRGDQDMPFSKPYKIIASWRETYNWKGQF